MEKVQQFEQNFGGQGEDIPKSSGGGAESQLEAKINKLYKNDDLDNKTKIA